MDVDELDAAILRDLGRLRFSPARRARGDGVDRAERGSFRR